MHFIQLEPFFICVEFQDNNQDDTSYIIPVVFMTAMFLLRMRHIIWAFVITRADFPPSIPRRKHMVRGWLCAWRQFSIKPYGTHKPYYMLPTECSNTSEICSMTTYRVMSNGISATDWRLASWDKQDSRDCKKPNWKAGITKTEKRQRDRVKNWHY